MNKRQMELVLTTLHYTTRLMVLFLTGFIGGMTLPNIQAAGTAPQITSHPQSYTNVMGSTAILTVIANGTAPLYYQWSKAGAAIPEATNDVFMIRNMQIADSGSYSVTIMNEYGSATSSNALLMVRCQLAGEIDTSFNLGGGINSDLYSVAVQSDGKVLIAGDFTSVDGAVRGRVARLNADGSTDHTFMNNMSGANNTVNYLAVQSDGKVLIGGFFTSVNNVSRSRIARLNADGSVDTTFQNGMSGANSYVYSLAIQPDGKVLIGGGFSIVNGVSRSRIARLNSDGSLDATFQNGVSGADGIVNAFGVQSDGKMLIAGDFKSVNGESRCHIARLNSDGTLDTQFQNGMSGANVAVHSLALQPNGKVLIGGAFRSVNGVSRNSIARLNADGSLDTTFQNGMSGADQGVRSLVVQSDGLVLIGGYFTSVNGVGRNRIARLNSDGSLDSAFQNSMSGADSIVHAFALQSDGKVLIGGCFRTVNGVSRNRIARLNSDGSVDTKFQSAVSGADKYVSSVAVQSDGKILIGGDFGSVNGVSRGRIARLNSDGSLDTTFLNGMSGADNYVSSLGIQSDGKVLIAGAFSTVNGTRQSDIARLNSDGTLDTTFLNTMNGSSSPVYCFAVQPDGKVVIGGRFYAGSRNNIARLNSDGTLDSAFMNGMSGAISTVHSIAIQADGKVLIGGLFSSVNGVSRKRIARLNSDGSVDTTFLNGLSGANNPVLSLVVQADGKVLIGGYFTNFNGVSRNSIARLNTDGSVDTTFQNGMSGVNSTVDCLAVQSDGKVLMGGLFSSVNGVARIRIARLNSDGSVDTTFQNGMSGADNTVNCLAVQSDGQVLIGGSFGGVNGVPSAGIARLWGNVMTTNYAPIGVADTRATIVNVPIALEFSELISNDIDPDGDKLSLLSVPTNTTQNGLLALDGNTVRYTPPANFVGLDSFVYAVTDGIGGANGATVRIQVGSLCKISPVTGGMGLSLYGTPGTVLWVQRSSDLRAWTTISTNTIPAGGTEIYTDNGLPLDKAFYRILRQ